MKRDKKKALKTTVKNLRWRTLGTNLVCATPNSKEELGVLALKGRLAVLNEGSLASATPRKTELRRKWGNISGEEY